MDSDLYRTTQLVIGPIRPRVDTAPTGQKRLWEKAA